MENTGLLQCICSVIPVVCLPLLVNLMMLLHVVTFFAFVNQNFVGRHSETKGLCQIFSLFIYVIVHSRFPILLSGLESVIFIIYFDAQIILNCPLCPHHSLSTSSIFGTRCSRLICSYLV